MPTYDELVFVASEKTVKEKGDADPRLPRRAARAAPRPAQRDPDAGLDAFLRANRDLDPKLQRAVLKVTLPLYAPPAGARSATRTRASGAPSATSCATAGLIQKGAEGAFTNDLLPGSGL